MLKMILNRKWALMAGFFAARYVYKKIMEKRPELPHAELPHHEEGETVPLKRPLGELAKHN